MENFKTRLKTELEAILKINISRPNFNSDIMNTMITLAHAGYPKPFEGLDKIFTGEQAYAISLYHRALISTDAARHMNELISNDGGISVVFDYPYEGNDDEKDNGMKGLLNILRGFYLRMESNMTDIETGRPIEELQPEFYSIRNDMHAIIEEYAGRI